MLESLRGSAREGMPNELLVHAQQRTMRDKRARAAEVSRCGRQDPVLRAEQQVLHDNAGPRGRRAALPL
jgi:hypothetical protein